MIKKLICILMLGVELAACKQAPNKKPVMTTTTGQADIDAGPVYEVTINSKGEFKTKPVKK